MNRMWTLVTKLGKKQGLSDMRATWEKMVQPWL